MTDRKIMTSAAAILAMGFATASVAQDSTLPLENDSPGMTAETLPAETLPADDLATGTDPVMDGTAAEDPMTAGEPALDTMDQTASPGMDDPLAPAPDAFGETPGQLAEPGMATPGAEAQTYGSVVSDLRNGADFSADAGAVVEDDEIRVVGLSTLQGEADASAEGLDMALQDSEADLTAGRDSLRDNDVLVEALEVEGYEADDVIALRRADDNSVEVIVDDRDA